jgi:hypothetical protein
MKKGIKMDFKTTIFSVMRVFNEEYPGKFSITETRQKVWANLLEGFDPRVILSACEHLVSTRPDWPPDIATMRETVIDFTHGELHQPSGQEAWENIKRKIQGEDFQLSDLEKAALKQVSTIYDLKRSENPTSDRVQYIKAFDRIIEKRRLERITLPAVKQLVAGHAPQLPSGPNDKLLEKTNDKEPVCKPEEVEELLADVPNREELKAMFKGAGLLDD